MGVHASAARLHRELAAGKPPPYTPTLKSVLAPMPSPHKKRSISDFFQPYIKSNVPAKRPAASGDLSPRKKSPSAITSPTRTPKTVRQRNDGSVHTPKATSFSPVSVGSAASLPFRSPHPNPTQSSSSTYKKGPLFGPGLKTAPTQKDSGTSFNFADLPGTSKSVCQDGEIVILDSDEETESLLSLADIFGKPQDDTSRSSSPEVDEAKNEAERVKTLSLFTRGRSDPLVGRDKLRALHHKQQAVKFDLNKLLDDHFGDEDNDKELQRARDNYNESTKPRDKYNARDMDQELLAAVASTEDGDDNVARLMDAVRRTEALSTDRVFSFFGARGPNDWQDSAPSTSSFPKSGIPNHLWAETDEHTRTRAFLSGFLAEMASHGKLPSEALTWTFHNLVIETRDNLRQAYIAVLSAGSTFWTRNNLTAEDVQGIFRTLGAESSSLDNSIEVEPRHRHVKASTRRNPKYLLAILELFRAICQDMDFGALSQITSFACRLSLDQELMSDARTCFAVEELLETLLSLPDPDMRLYISDRLLADIGQNVKSPILQCQFLEHIHATSSSTTSLRVLLAQYFLLGPKTHKLREATTTETFLDALHKHITVSDSFNTSRHKTNDSTDYVALKSLTHILDIAISDGGRPGNFNSRADEIRFNRSVDRLAETVRDKFISIVDTGASHISRTEAKDVLRALYWRLLYSVRTEERLKKGVFDEKSGKHGGFRDASEVRSEEKSRDIMKGFLARRKEVKIERQEDDSQETILGTGQLPTQDNSIPQQNPDKASEDNEHPPTIFATTSSTISDSSTSTAQSETEQQIRRQLGCAS